MSYSTAQPVGLNQRSMNNLSGVHADLVRVLQRARQYDDFTVIQGLRSLEEQKRNVAKGVSKTMNSRHLTGHAIDFIPNKYNGKDVWKDHAAFTRTAEAIKRAAQEEGVNITWGGDWKGGWDKPHIELARAPNQTNPSTIASDVTKTVTQVGQTGTMQQAPKQDIIQQLFTTPVATNFQQPNVPTTPVSNDPIFLADWLRTPF